VPSGDGFAIQLQGRLALLMDAPNVYPNMRIAASGGSVVAEEGFEPPTQGL
jgi:site-specific DNA recombinase